ncbi:MAG: DUF6292 family protein [Actinophytocola sp.]|uniref:DUF6292 family protein n=1 Tax=Actinophytocola sp. TaxID=1872138 RepID=UPI003C7118FA
MTPTPRTLFVEGRTRAEEERRHQQQQAVRTVAGNARDLTDFSALLAMLGLEDPAQQNPMPLSRQLAVYVREVAAAIGVPAEATGHEVTDTATAYIALDQRSASRPDHDLMLAWDERLGWYVAVETTPNEPAEIVAYLCGDAVPTPAAVARFVADTTTGRSTSRIRPVLPRLERATLAKNMATVC